MSQGLSLWQSWYTIPMRKKIVIANWKMNPSTPKDALKLFTQTQKVVAKTRGVEVVVCPPTIFLSDLARKRGVSRKILLGAQDVFFETEGAHTGETSARAVHAYKAHYTIVGHSERRAHGETNEAVAKKAQCALREGLTAVVCVGEKERNDDGAYYAFLREQTETVFSLLSREDLTRLIIAYEPVWAIGKDASHALNPDGVYETVLFIRKLLIERFEKTAGSVVPILYGGAVKAENAGELLERGGVDGFLVGSASLDAEVFGEIVKKTEFSRK
jgi:triosephosphate isomerase